MLIALILALLFTPCADETSQNCTWYGGSNQVGQTFTDLNGNAHYWEK